VDAGGSDGGGVDGRQGGQTNPVDADTPDGMGGAEAGAPCSPDTTFTQSVPAAGVNPQVALDCTGVYTLDVQTIRKWSLTDGSPLWSKTADGPTSSSGNPATPVSLAAAAHGVYAAGPTTQLRKWAADGGSAWAIDDPTVVAFWAVAASSDAVYTAARLPAEGGTSAWRIDKRAPATGAAQWSAVARTGRVTQVAVTSEGVYLLNSQDIEKRALSDGSYLWDVLAGQNAGSIATIASTDQITYLAGSYSGGSNVYDTWLLGAYSASDGGVAWRNASYTPVAQGPSYPTGGNEWAQAVTVSRDGLWAVGGANVYNSGQNGRAWTVVRLDPATGGVMWKAQRISYVAATSFPPFPNNDPNGIAVDGNALYVVGTGTSFGDGGPTPTLRLEKMRAGDGGL
jgi:hypothetical protein